MGGDIGFMDSDQGKLFIGGISWETTDDRLEDYFAQYGDVLQAVVMKDKTTGRPRGFGFVVFADPSILDRVLQDKHTIDGRTVDAKRAMSREEQQTNARTGYLNASRNTGNGGNIRTKKIFVGGLPPTLTDVGFRQYFEAYGHVTDVVIMYDQNTQRPRGFGFISFDTEEAVDQVLHKAFHDLNGKQVEVKRALPKDANPGGGTRSAGSGSFGGSGAGGYPGYGGSGSNVSSYDGRMDSNRYMQHQGTGGGYPPYGSSGFGATGYGYGPANNGVGYGGYGNYGGAGTGYGGSAAYGNPNVTNAGYASGPPGGPRSSWSSQAPSGYGGMSYGSATSWGAHNTGTGAGSGGPASAAAGQSPSGVTGYGSQSYGYGNYGGNDGSFSNLSGYGAVGVRSGGPPNINASGPAGGELQGGASAYMGSGYGDASGNPGYGNTTWRSEPSQASGNYGTNQANGSHGQVGYGGYGGGLARQAQ